MFWTRLSFAALLIASANASAATIRCDDCTETMYESKAIAAGLGVHYTYDLIKAHARKYQVGLECDDNANDGRTTCQKVAWPLTVESEITNATLELAAYRLVTDGTMKSHFTIVANGPAQNFSAFDVAGPGGPLTQLIGWFETTQSWSIGNTLPFLGASVHQLTVQALSLYNDSLGATLVTVQFSDGTEITLSYNMVNHTTEAVQGSAKDRFGNVIPASVEDLNRLRFDFTREQPNGPAYRRMQEYLTAIGAIFVGTPVKWTCVRVGDGKWECKGI